jgi:hypothetical protein
MRRPSSPEKSGIELGLQAIATAHVLYLVPLAGIEFCIQVIDFTVF